MSKLTQVDNYEPLLIITRVCTESCRNCVGKNRANDFFPRSRELRQLRQLRTRLCDES